MGLPPFTSSLNVPTIFSYRLGAMNIIAFQAICQGNIFSLIASNTNEIQHSLLLITYD